MADLKISALTASSTPLAGTEVLPIVQSSTTKQVSVANLTAGRAVTASKFTAVNNQDTLVAQSANNGGSTLLSYKDVAGTTLWDVGIGAYIEQDELAFRRAGATVFYLDKNSNARIISGNLTLGTAAKGVNFTANTPAAGMTSQLLNWYEEGTWTPVLSRESGGPITATTSNVIAKYTKIGNLVTVSLFLEITGVTSQGTSSNEIRGLPFAPADNSLGAGSVGRNSTFTTDVVHNCWVWSDSRIIFSSNVNSASATAVDWKTGYINLTMTYTV